MIDLKDKVALITGGSRGIGRATAIMMARSGADVAVNYCSNEKRATEVANECRSHGVRALAIKADVADQEQVEAMVHETVSHLERIDILVNNAGIWVNNPIDGMDVDRMAQTFDTNVKGCFYTAMAVVPHMKKQGSGNIINISSTAGQRGEAFYSPYAASKGALIAMTKSLAVELAPHNIRVNCVAPGWVDTDMSHSALVGSDARAITRLIPLGRAGTAEELAGPILFMASELSTFVTGEVLNVNGGAVLCG